MNITKRKIVDLPLVYSTTDLSLKGKKYLAVASEAVGEHAYIIDPVTYEYSDLWFGDTGVMNIVQIPDDDRLLAITKFYPIFQSKEAQICLIEPSERGYMSPWSIRPVLDLPFCHRIGTIKNHNGSFLLGCQLCHDKDYQEDWTQPGSLWMAKIPSDYNEKWEWHELFSGLTKNHGLFIQDNCAYICSESGIMKFDLTDYELGQYVYPVLVSTTPTSDIWFTNNENEVVAVTIEPFHGDTFGVYKYGSKFESIASYDINFGHVAWVGEINGKTMAIAGSRGGKEELELIDFETGERIVIDEGIGPTQITVFKEESVYYILSANHGSGDVTVYSIS